ncbi:hypothetical protein [Mesorhizobium sp. CN2-181]|uniref:hypothetical protein n=1 Tax=Mesorhizobium yinganensis TaxID=3157707 RepID=UPI0032B72EFA
MSDSTQTIWEDDDYVYIPEELFKHLPPEYRAAAEARKQQGSDMLQIADQDIKSLIRLINAVPTTASLGYIYHRLRTTEFDVTSEALMEQELLTTAFVVTYSRLFVSGSGAGGFSRDQIPSHLQGVHDDIIDIRHKRYAHNDRHGSITGAIKIDFDDTEVRVNLQMGLGLYIGGRNEWQELITFLDERMYERLQKILGRLSAKTGYKWKFPVGPGPDWAKESG